MMTKLWMSAGVAGLALALAGCQQAPEDSAEKAPVAAVAPVKLPVSINAAMVGLVDHSADYIFAMGNGDLPKNDHDWDLVRSASYDMLLGGTVTQIEGTGQHDAQWVANPEWQKLAQELTVIGQDALKLTEAKSTDVVAWKAVGDRLIQNCLSCHEKFKPEVPSQGILHESTERESRGISIFD
jgi:hypothetical protein